MDYQFRSATFNGFNREDVIAYIETTVESHTSRVQRLQDKLSSATTSLEQATKAEEEKSFKIRELSQNIDELREELESKGPPDTVALTEEIETLKITIATLESNIKNNELALGETEKQYASEIRNLELELEQAKGSGGGGDSDALQSELETTQLRLERMTQTLEELEMASEQSDMEVNQLKTQLAQAQAAAGGASDEEVARFKADIEQLREELSTALNTSNGASEEELEQFRREIAKREEQIDLLTEEYNQAKIEMAQITKVSRQVEEEAENARDHIESLKLTVADLEGAIQAHESQSTQQRNEKQKEQDALASNYEAKLTALQNELTAQKNDTAAVDELKQELEAAQQNAQKLASVNEKFQIALDQNEELTEEINTINKKVKQLDRELADHQEQVADLESELESKREKLKKIHKLEVDLEASQEQLDKMTHLESDFNAAQGRLSHLNQVESDLSAAEQKLEKLNLLETEYASLQEKLMKSAGLEAELNYTKEKLAKSEEQLRAEQAKADKLDLVEPELASTKDKLEEIRTERDELQERLSSSTAKDEVLLLENKIASLSQQVKELELTLLEEKQSGATVQLDLDKAKDAIAEHLDQEWVLNETIRKLTLERDTLTHKLSQAEPSAKAYHAIKDRVARMELDAHCRAQDTISEAEAEVFRLQEQVEQWLARINSSYSSLWLEVEDNIKNVDKGLVRASQCLTEINTVMNGQENSFSQLARKHIQNNNAPQQLSAENPPPQQGGHSPQWSYEPPPTPQWNHEQPPSTAWNHEQAAQTQWNTHHWAEGPTPLPLEDEPTGRSQSRPIDENPPKRFNGDFKLFQ